MKRNLKRYVDQISLSYGAFVYLKNNHGQSYLSEEIMSHCSRLACVHPCYNVVKFNSQLNTFKYFQGNKKSTFTSFTCKLCSKWRPPSWFFCNVTRLLDVFFSCIFQATLLRCQKWRPPWLQKRNFKCKV